VVESFHGDRFLLTFNAAAVCPEPAVRAVEAMVVALGKLRTRRDVAAYSGMLFGVSSGKALCGNLGNRSMQRFSVVGPCVVEAFALSHFAKAEGFTNALSEGTLQALPPGRFAHMHIGFAMLPKAADGTLLSTVIGLRKDQSAVAWPSGTVPPPSDTVLAMNNQAFEVFASGEFARARELASNIPAPYHQAIERSLQVLRMRSALF
jgi:hypothetical protein